MSEAIKMRLDQLLIERFGYDSRSRARDAILRGCISLDGVVLSKPSRMLSIDCPLKVSDDAGRFVSRAALKLVHALDVAKLNVSGKTCVDLGASTGGFTQVLLERGAEKVFAIDVGHGQFHPSLEGRTGVVKIENLNVRNLTLDDINNAEPDILVSDLSFISLKLALPPALALAKEAAVGVFLIKPQFEVGRENIASGGIVRDQEIVEKTVEALCVWMNNQKPWHVLNIFPSPILGGDGNKEFLMIAQKGETQ